MLTSHPQWILAVLFLVIGFGCGFIIGILTLINIMLGKKKWIEIVCDILSCLSITITYIISINSLNWGQSRGYLVIFFVVGIIFERKTLGKLFAKLYHKLYNQTISKIKKISNSKIGEFLKR